MKRITCIIILGVLSVSAASSQQFNMLDSHSVNQLKMISPNYCYPNLLLRPVVDSLNQMPPPLVISKNYSKDHYGIFCKWEDKLQKSSKVPVRFRIGTLEYVNKLEGKQ